MEGPEKLRLNRGIAWIGLASSLVAILDAFALLLILRTWISPAEFGVATLVVTIFPILDLATDMGLSSAVIQRDDHTPERIATVFWLNLALSLVLAALLWPAGQLLAAFHGAPIVASLLAAYGGKLVFQNLYFIPNAMLRRELRYKEISLIRIFANCAEFVGKIGFAAGGFGAWTFVLAPLARVLVTGVGTQLCHPWRPRFLFRLSEARAYISFGLKTSGSQILFYFYTNVDYQVVGRVFGPTALGYYRWAYELVLEPVRIISGVVVEIAFPVFARLRARRAVLIEQLIAFTRQNLALAVPFLSVVLLCAHEILVVALGPEWGPAAPAVRILCGVGVLRAVSFVLPPLLDGIGHPGRTLVYMAVAGVCLPAAYIVFALQLGPTLGYLSVALAWAVVYPLAFGVLAWLALSSIGLPTLVYLRRIAGIPGCALIAIAGGLAARVLTAELPAGVRLAVVATVTLGILAVLLAYLQGISLRSVVRALRGK
jgi:O-antigen/teichoic acid export membrane protein